MQINKIQQQIQEYQLKLGIIHHSSLKTTQLIQFLQNQTNQFLQNDLVQYIKSQQQFITVFESFSSENQQFNEYIFQQYVGLILIYSTGSQQSFEYFMKNIKQILNLQISDLFIIVIQMDNSQKQTNLIGNQGQRYCNKNSLQYVKLSLYNSQDLLNIINKNLYQLIQNYYYPNQQQEYSPNKQIIKNNKKKQKSFQKSNDKQKSSYNNDSKKMNQNYIFKYQNKNIQAYSIQMSPIKHKMQEMFTHAVQLRKSRQRQIQQQQQQIDESMANVQNVLNNINKRINQKLKSGWFTQLSKNLYLSTQKNSLNFSKIKLTQQFIDDIPKKGKKIDYTTILQSRFFDSQSTSLLNFNVLKYQNISYKNSVLKIVLFFSKENVIELQIYENSTYEQLALSILRRIGKRETQKNKNIIIDKIKKRIQSFSKQLTRAIKLNQQKKIHQRSYLKSKSQQTIQ